MKKTLENPEAAIKMDNPEKLAALGTQDEEKHNTICAGQNHVQANTNNINKT